MSIPRPKTENVLETLEEETQLNWEVKNDKPDLLTFITEIWKFEIIWDGNGWYFELYDVSDRLYGDDEPKWALGRMRNGTKVLQELPEFIPHEVKA